MQGNRSQINLIFLSQCSILEQLHLEEALLRADGRNWCLIHQNPSEAIVMGISGHPEQVINIHRMQQKPVPLIRRFSGGGTVFIDENCIMATFICNQTDMDVPCFPQPVFQWSERFYRPIFQGLDFGLRENDYVIGSKKFGGNAQYMTKNRWLHHTSFLWDYNPDKMAYLKMPPKYPQYRQQRSHTEFLCTMNAYFPDRQTFLEKLCMHLKSYFAVREANIEEVYEIARLPHRRASVIETIET